MVCVCVCGGGGGGSPNTTISLPMNYTVFGRVARGVVQVHLIDRGVTYHHHYIWVCTGFTNLY